MSSEIESRLLELIVSSGEDVDFHEINENTDLIKDLSFDSMSLIQLILDIEKEFDIEIDADNLVLERFSQYKDLVTMLDEMLSKEGKKLDVM